MPEITEGILSSLNLTAYNDNLLVDNDLIARRFPLIWGSGSSIRPFNNSAYNMKIPSYGFMTGAPEFLCLEFWLQLELIDAEPFTDDILTSAKEIIRFSQYSYLALYRNQFVFVYGDDYIIAEHNKFDCPMLVNINYARKGQYIYVSIFVDGEIIASDKFSYTVLDARTTSIVFSNKSNYRLIYGPILMYPYNITKELALKHFVYGHGTRQPQSYQNMAGNKLTELGSNFSKMHLTAIDVPGTFSWDEGKSSNLEQIENTLAFLNYNEPTYIKCSDEVTRYFFNNSIQYFYDIPYGMGLEANVTRRSTGEKAAIMTIRLNQDFMILYMQDTFLNVDIQNRAGFVEKVISYDISSSYDSSISKYKINTGFLFSFLSEFTTIGNQLLRDPATKVTVGYIDDDINSPTKDDPDNPGLLSIKYYYPLPPDEIPHLIKFLNEDIDNDVDDTNGIFFDYHNASLNWKHEGSGGRFFQRGKWQAEFPISVLTSFVDTFGEDGLRYTFEDIDFIQFNIDNNWSTSSYITVYDHSIGTNEFVIDDNLNFDTITELLGNKVLIKDNEMLNLPDISPEKYKDLIVRVTIEIDINRDNLVTENLNLRHVRLLGITNKHIEPLIFGNATEGNVVPFARTSHMIFPRWDTDIQLVTPSMDMTFFYLNKHMAYYLVNDGTYNDPVWDKGFLTAKHFNRDGKDKIYGFQTFMNVEVQPAGTKKLLRLNPIDGAVVNPYGHLSIEWTASGTYKIKNHLNPAYEPQVWMSYLNVDDNSLLQCDTWFILTVIFKTPIVFDTNQSKSMYLEFLAPNVYFTNFNIFAVNDNYENKFAIDYYIGNNTIVSYLLSILSGLGTLATKTSDGALLAPIIQNAWTSAYINVLWDNVSVQIQNTV